MTRKKRVYRIFKRSLGYWEIGYTKIIHKPLAVSGFLSVIYLTLTELLPSINLLFPSFVHFIVFGFVAVAILGGTSGYIFFKYLPFFSGERDVIAKYDPYTSEKVYKSQLPLFKGVKTLLEKHGLSTSELDSIIEKSERQ